LGALTLMGPNPTVKKLIRGERESADDVVRALPCPVGSLFKSTGRLRALKWPF
jgi:hypothetical protein